MDLSHLLSPSKTNAVRGICALAIFLFHIIIGISSSAVFHFWGGMFVAVFLILSGYGINESFHKHGLKDYWHKRLTKVIVPTLVFASCFSLFDPQRNMQTLVSALYNPNVLVRLSRDQVLHRVLVGATLYGEALGTIFDIVCSSLLKLSSLRYALRIRTIVLILVWCTLVREERMVQPPVSTKGARGCVWLFPYRVIGFWLKDLTNLARLYRYGAL